MEVQGRLHATAAPAWLEGEGMVGTCWLVGSGAHDGFTFYLFHYKVPSEAIGHVQGIIYPGAPLASS